MNIIQKNLKPLTIFILFFFLFHQSGPPDALAHCPCHSGQSLGGGQTGSPPEDEDDPGEPEPKDKNEDESDNKPEDYCEIPDDPKTPSNDGSEGDPIYLFDGKFFYYHTDLRIPGRIPLKIGRSYDSYCLYNGPFGFGWSFTYNIRVFRLSDGNLLLRRGSNAKDTFTAVGPNTYEGPAGNYETIVINQDGTYTLTKKTGYKYQFDINGCLSAVEDRNDNSVRMTYDPAGKLPINGISPFSNITTPIVIGYDWRLIKIEQYSLETPTGRFIEFFYNDDGRITRIADFANREVLYTYDANGTGDLLTMEDPEGNLYTYTYENHLMTSYVGLGCSDCGPYTNIYDSEKRVIQQTHGNLAVDIDYLVPKSKTKVTTSIYDDDTLALLNTRYEYYEFNSTGFVTKFTRQMGLELDETGSETDDIVSLYSYNPNNELTQKIDPRWAISDYAYDSSGNLLSETQMIDDINSITNTYMYEPNYNRMASKEISSTAEVQRYRTEYTYDANGNLATETTFVDTNDPNTAMTTSYTYNEYGDVLTITKPKGNITANEYDPNGFLTRVFDPNHPTRQTLYSYDALGNMISTTDAKGNTTTFEYDNLGRITKVTNALGIETINTYDSANLVQIEEGKTASENGRITIMEYDGLNRKTALKMVDDGNEVALFSYTYDSQGQVLTSTDGNGNTTTNTYDVLGRLTTVADPNGFPTTFIYDKAGNVIQTTDAELNSTYYTYDYVNRLTDVTDALGNTTSYTYNALGNILTVTDARSNTTTHFYDEAGRLIQVIDPGGHTTQYVYDRNGNLTEKITPNEFSDFNGTDPIVYTYDEYNQLTQTNYPDGKVVTFSYDYVGNMIGWDDGTLSGSNIYDELNRPTQVATNYPDFSKTVVYTYNRFGEKETLTDAEGQVTTYNYDALGRLTTIEHPDSLTTQYTYDTGGRLSEKILPNSVETTYKYDISNRLTELTNIAPDQSTISYYSYTHDNVGNRLTMTTLEGTHNYSYDATYQLFSAVHPNQPDETYTYDAVGNRLTSADFNDWTYDNTNRLLSYDGVFFTYDDNGNTISKSDSNGTTTYAYDYENRLISAITPSHTATYSYDPFGKRLSKTVDSVTTYYCYDNEDIIAEYDSSSNLTTKYYHGPRTDEPISMFQGGQVYYYTFNGLSSVTELTNSDGTIIGNYIYDAFGNMTKIPMAGNPYAYTSREYDTETYLFFYRARYYDSTIGRFISADPPGFASSTNFYNYVDNNPINLIDPQGLFYEAALYEVAFWLQQYGEQAYTILDELRQKIPETIEELRERRQKKYKEMLSTYWDQRRIVREALFSCLDACRHKKRNDRCFDYEGCRDDCYREWENHWKDLRVYLDWLLRHRSWRDQH